MVVAVEAVVVDAAVVVVKDAKTVNPDRNQLSLLRKVLFVHICTIQTASLDQSNDNGEPQVDNDGFQKPKSRQRNRNRNKNKQQQAATSGEKPKETEKLATDLANKAKIEQ